MIDMSTVVVTVVDNATIAPAAESTSDAEVETLAFNFRPLGTPAFAGCD